MKNFSDISNITLTGKDHLINKMVSSTGLSKERVEKLYENFSISNNGDLVKINESFTDFINPSSTLFNFTKFKETIVSLSNKIVEPSNDIESRERITNEMFNAIADNCGINVDTPTLIEIICYVLLLNDRDKCFEKVATKIGFGLNTKQLFENEKIDFSKIKVLKTNTKESNIINAKEHQRLFESIREILAKNNKSWGYNYHLDNAYTAIVDYIDKESIELTNIDNIYTVEENFEMDLINQIVTQNQLNPMYRSIDVLRKLIPDIQTLVFDCMLLIHNHISNNQYSLQFVNRNSFNDYLAATKTLFSAISSSTLSSKIAINKENLNKDDSNYQLPNFAGTEYSQIFDNFIIDTTKVDIYTYPIIINSAVDMLHIIKSCETEFNLRLRKVINNYFTKTINLLASTEKILIEQRKTNKFKNGI
jgi:hypothetical protein